jgi:hypothetical protein
LSYRSADSTSCSCSGTTVLSTALTDCDSFDGTWVVRPVSDPVEFVLDASGVSSLVASTDVGLAQGVFLAEPAPDAADVFDQHVQ